MRRLVALALFACAAACSGGGKATSLPPDQAKKLLLDRNWVDQLPKSVDDKLHVFRFVPSMGGGVFQDRTLFFGTFELFQFKHDGRVIDFDLLHTGDRKQSSYRIDELPTPGPEGVDIVLTLSSSPRGPSVYYSWRNQSGDLDGQLARLYNDARSR